MREIDSVNGHFEPVCARDEFYQPIDDEVPDLDPIQWAREMGYEVSPEANFRCGREIVEGQFSILKLARISSELRLTDEQRLKIQKALAGQSIGTLSDGFDARIGNKHVGSKFVESHKRFMDVVAHRRAENGHELESLKKMGHKRRKEAVDVIVRSEAERVLTAEAALYEITLRNMQLAKHVANKYKGSSTLPILDLFQVANIGIMTAAARYDFNVGQFSTYAHNWAMKEVKSAIAECDGVMTLPERARNELARNLKKIEKREQQLGRTLTSAELDGVLVEVRGKTIEEREERLGRRLTEDELDSALVEVREKFFDSLKCWNICLLSEPVRSGSGYGEAEFGDTIVSEEPEVDDIAMRYFVGNEVRIVMNEVLTPRERLALNLRFGISDGRPRSLDKVGEKFGITGEGARKAEVVAFEKLRADGRLEQLKEIVAI